MGLSFVITLTLSGSNSDPRDPITCSGTRLEGDFLSEATAKVEIPSSVEARPCLRTPGSYVTSVPICDSEWQFRRVDLGIPTNLWWAFRYRTMMCVLEMCTVWALFCLFVFFFHFYLKERIHSVWLNVLWEYGSLCCDARRFGAPEKGNRFVFTTETVYCFSLCGLMVHLGKWDHFRLSVLWNGMQHILQEEYLHQMVLDINKKNINLLIWNYFVSDIEESW